MKGDLGRGSEQSGVVVGLRDEGEIKCERIAILMLGVDVEQSMRGYVDAAVLMIGCFL